MHNCYNPELVFGVYEPSDDAILSEDVIFSYYVDYYAEEVVRNFAINIIYGVSCTIDQVRNMNQKDIDAAMLDPGHSFSKVKRFVDELRALGVEFEDPKFILCVSGDYELEQNEYNLEEAGSGGPSSPSLK